MYATCEDAAAAIYGFPPVADAAMLYTFGFGLVFLPYLLFWMTGKVIELFNLAKTSV